VHAADSDSEEDGTETSFPERVGPMRSELEERDEGGSGRDSSEDESEDDSDGRVGNNQVRELEGRRVVHQTNWSSVAVFDGTHLSIRGRFQ